jgi:serine protease AprX
MGLAGGIALATVVVALTAMSPQAESRGELAAAQLDVPRGVAHGLSTADSDRARVRVLLRKQPVLAATQRPGFRRAVAMRSVRGLRRAARRSPDAVTHLERSIASTAERRLEAIMADLEDESVAAARAAAPTRKAIRAVGGRVIESSSIPNSIVARVPVDELDGVAESKDVQAIVPAPRERPALDTATPLVGSPSWWSAGHLGGEGPNDTVPADAGLLGEGVDPGHPAYAGLVTLDQSPDVDINDHGTHTGGIIISNNLPHAGTAGGVDKLVTGEDELYLLGLPDGSQAGAGDPAESWNVSSSGTPGGSDDADNTEDLISQLFGVGWAQSAGNDGPDAGSIDTIGRNLVSVGAFSDLNTSSTSDDVIASFSSRGPTPGGRKKPDLIAPGVGITAPDADWEVGDDFTPETGTSFSSPFVAGGMALMEGAGIVDPKVQRAILVNSARDWPGQTHWQTDAGWGALDLATALAQRGNFAASSVEDGGAHFFRANSMAGGAKTTLAWNMRGVWGSFPTCCFTAYTTTNLDLRQYLGSTLAEVAPPLDPGHGGGPDAVDPNDTIEQVRAPAGGPQEIIYKVEASSSVVGVAEEPFAIASAQPLTALANPEADPVNSTADHSGTVNCQTDVVISTELANESPDLDAGSAQVTLNLPSGVMLVSGSSTQQVSGGVLERSTPASETHSWTVRATSSGAKQLTITGSGGTMGETFVSADHVSFTADCSPPTVTPTGTTVSPPGAKPCGTDQAISTTLRNISATDAQSAEVALELPPGVVLVSDAATQPVSGGVLESATTSEQHSWTVRPTQPDLSATISGSGSDGSQAFAYPQTVPIGCQPAGDGGGGGVAGPETVTVAVDRLRIRSGRLIVEGHASAGFGPAPGRVGVQLKRGRRTMNKAGELLDGRYAVRFRLCRPGRWKATATYGGAPGFAAAVSPASELSVREGKLRC